MKDTKRIDEEIKRILGQITLLNGRIYRLEQLKMQTCMDCKDKYCIHAGTADDIVCQSHSVYGGRR